MNNRVGSGWSVLMMCGVAFAACGTQAMDPPGERPPQSPSAYRDAVLGDRPIAYWRLDERRGARAHDQTPAANHGMIDALVRLQQPGATPADGNLSMAFNGKGRIYVLDHQSLQVTGGAITLEAWVKPLTQQPGQVFIVCKGRAGVQTEYGLVLMDGVLAYQSVVEHYLSTAGPLPLGEWTHVAVTVADNAGGTFYVGGVEAGTFSSTSRHIVTASSHPLTIGTEVDAASGAFVGAIDDVAVYARSLTADQIANHVAAAARSLTIPSQQR